MTRPTRVERDLAIRWIQLNYVKTVQNVKGDEAVNARVLDLF